MALIICEDCGNQVSDKAKSCPHCGCPIQKKSSPENPEFRIIYNEYVDLIKKEIDPQKIEKIYSDFEKKSEKMGMSKHYLSSKVYSLYSDTLEKIEFAHKTTIEYNFSNYTTHENAMFSDVEQHEYFYVALSRKYANSDEEIYRLYNEYKKGRKIGFYEPRTEDRIRLVNDFATLTKASVSNAVAQNYHKKNPYVVGGLVDGALGPAAGLYSAIKTSEYNQKVDEIRADATASAQEAIYAKNSINNYLEQYTPSDNWNILANNIIKYIDKICPDERKRLLGDYYKAIEKRIEEKRLQKDKDEMYQLALRYYSSNIKVSDIDKAIKLFETLGDDKYVKLCLEKRKKIRSNNIALTIILIICGLVILGSVITSFYYMFLYN